MKTVVRQQKIGPHGNTSWAIELDCGHINHSDRRSPKLTRCCTQCNVVEENVELQPLETDFSRQELLLAHRLGVDSDQVTIFEEGARVSLFQIDVLRLIKS